MQEDRIISTLIGLVGACNNNPKTENTDRLILKALTTPSDPQTIDAIVSAIQAEKNQIAPGCASCAMPCGNTSDYDMDRIYHAEERIRSVKLQILSELQETAAYICQNDVSIPKEKMDFFFKALSCISYDLETENLCSLLEEAREIKRGIKTSNL